MDNVKVGGMTYEIQKVPSVEINGDMNHYGLCDYKNTRILLLDSVPEQRQDQTLVHEILHAAFDETGLSLENEEDIVNRVGLVLYQVLKDNDFSWLNEKNVEELNSKDYPKGTKLMTGGLK